MNVLPIETQAQVLGALVEGSSIRSTERMTGVHRDTIGRLVLRVGAACERFQDGKLRDLPCEHVQVDELWCYVGKKQRHVTPEDDASRVGDTWTWVAIDSDTKLIPSYLVGKRTTPFAMRFMEDLASRLRNRIQLSSDDLKSYLWAVNRAFHGDVDYAVVVKSYESEPIGPGRYSPPKVVSVTKREKMGRPDMRRASTSYIERQNLNIRMGMRRFTRLTNGFSKKLENLKAAVSLHFAYHNFCRVHRTLRTTPAVAVGLESQPWTITSLVETVSE